MGNDSISVSDGGRLRLDLQKLSLKSTYFWGSRQLLHDGQLNSCHGGEGRLALLMQFESCSKPKGLEQAKSRFCCHHQHLFARAFRPEGQLRVFALYSIWALELPNHAVKFVDPCTSDTVLRPDRP